ncbi:MAG: hypothetical protein KUG77_24835, partial [Nannocystaceae bacterium]|nr:hypothetical protein [Nannocystaceae bacterium]
MTALLAVVGSGLGLAGFLIGWVIDDVVLGLMTGAAVWGTAIFTGLALETSLFFDARRLHILSSTGTFVLGDRQLSFDDLVAPRRENRLERILQKEPGDPTEAPIPFVVIGH